MWPLLAIFLSGCSIMLKEKVPESAKGSQYSIYFSEKDWIEKKEERSDYVLENKLDGRIMLSNSFCGQFQDLPLDVLAEKTVNSLSDFKTTKKEYSTFLDREAYRVEGVGSIDGVKVGLRLLNTRRNNCYFDFLAITPASAREQVKDFEKFLNSVEFK